MVKFCNTFLCSFFLFGAAFCAYSARAEANIKSALHFERNFPEGIKAGIEADLAMMGELRLDGVSKFHQKIFGKNSNYADWFLKRISEVGAWDCGDAIAVACLNPKINRRKIFLTPNYTSANSPQISRIALLIHEARHSENKKDNWNHAICPKPFLDPEGKDVMSIWTGAKLAGEDACDETPFGSYGVTVIFLKNISNFCTSCSEKTKLDAEIYGADQLIRISKPSAHQEMVEDIENAKAKYR